VTRSNPSCGCQRRHCRPDHLYGVLLRLFRCQTPLWGTRGRPAAVVSALEPRGLGCRCRWRLGWAGFLIDREDRQQAGTDQRDPHPQREPHRVPDPTLVDEILSQKPVYRWLPHPYPAPSTMDGWSVLAYSAAQPPTWRPTPGYGRRTSAWRDSHRLLSPDFSLISDVDTPEWTIAQDRCLALPSS
jgi:hypothetical protein